MTMSADKLKELRVKFVAQLDKEEARLENERAFLQSVLDKSLGKAAVKDKAAKEKDAVALVTEMFGLG